MTLPKRDPKEFMEALKGVKTYVVARAFSDLTSGINWRGCSKQHMAESWAQGDYLWVRMNVELSALRKRAKEIEDQIRQSKEP